jgi:hypothetical protein
MSDRYPCPCCGHVVFDEPPGSYAICPVCFWVDDPVQLRWPDWAGGANKPSLEREGDVSAAELDGLVLDVRALLDSSFRAL